MRRAAKIDANHSAIVSALRKIGASVQSLAAIGKGCPDILVGFRGRNWLMEIKDGMLKPSARRLTDDEASWHRRWFGQVHLVQSVDEALKLVGEQVTNER